VIAGRRGHLPAAARHVRAGIEASLALRDRRLLSSGTYAALTLLGEHADPAQRARLLGAWDALVQATGAPPLWAQVSVDQGVVGLRERLEREGWAAEYREGRSLPFAEVAAQALTMLEDVTRTLARPDLPNRPPDRQASREGPLSKREWEVLQLVAQELPNKAIARQLFISASTVNYHLTSVFHKLAVDTRAQAVAVAGRHGLL